MKRIVFMGTPDFAVPILEELIEKEYDIVLAVTQPDRPKGRKKIVTPPPVKTKANEHGIPVLQPEKLKDAYEKILAYGPDLIITAAYGQILPIALLERPPFGCINVHASLLPELRGGAPIHYALLQGKKETGITIMYMAEKLDAGDILMQRRIAIEENDHAGSLHDRLSEVGASLLGEALPRLFDNELNPEKQDEEKVTFAPNIKRTEEKLDFTRTHKEIYNHIRGMHPWPVAFTTYEGKQMKIWWAQLDDTVYNKRVPGEIVQKDSESFTIVCGNRKGIRVVDIQPSGKKRMPVSDFLLGAGAQLTIGEKMGD